MEFCRCGCNLPLTAIKSHDKKRDSNWKSTIFAMLFKAQTELKEVLLFGPEYIAITERVTTLKQISKWFTEPRK